MQYCRVLSCRVGCSRVSHNMEPSYTERWFFPVFSKSERFIHSLLGPTRSDIRPLALSLDRIIFLQFIQQVPKGDIRLSHNVYPHVALLLNRSHAAVARSTERLTNLCWEAAVEQELLMKIIGRSKLAKPYVSDILFYFACYLHFDKPFFSVLNDLDDLNHSNLSH